MKRILLTLILAIMAGTVHVAAARQDTVAMIAVVDRGAIVVETPMVSLPIHVPEEGGDHVHSAVFPPVVEFELPVSGYLFGVEYELVDEAGRSVPRRLLHHFNLIDPGHREVFLPIARRVFAAGQETGAYAMPKTLVGVPFEAGDRWILSAMMHNPTDQAWENVTLRVRARFVRRGLPWPLAEVVPFQMDTLFPTGDKSFDLPPGQSSRSWEGYPITEGRIIAIGSHLHEMATGIRLEDAVDDTILWSGSPVYDDTGQLERTTRGEFYGTYGILLDPERTYRVVVDYDNPGPDTVPDGGMGVIAGLVIPSEPEFDFSSNPSDSLYVADRIHFMRESMELNSEMEMNQGVNER